MAFAVPLIAAAGAAGGSSLLGAGLTTALGIGSAALTGVSALQNGYYQAAVAKNNAAVADRNAAAVSEAAQRNAMRSDQDYAAERAGVMSEQATSGLDLLGRTQSAARRRVSDTGRLAAGDIRAQGTNEARRLMQDAASFRAEGKQAKRQGFITALGAGLDAGMTFGRDAGFTRSLVGTGGRRGGRRPWDHSPNWYGRG